MLIIFTSPITIATSQNYVSNEITISHLLTLLPSTYRIILYFLFHVFKQIVAQVYRISAFVDAIHVVGVLMRADPLYYEPISSLNQILHDRAYQHGYIYHGPGSKMNNKNIYEADGVHLTTIGIFNLQALLKKKIIRRY